MKNERKSDRFKGETSQKVEPFIVFRDRGVQWLGLQCKKDLFSEKTLETLKGARLG